MRKVAIGPEEGERARTDPGVTGSRFRTRQFLTARLFFRKKGKQLFKEVGKRETESYTIVYDGDEGRIPLFFVSVIFKNAFAVVKKLYKTVIIYW